MTRVGITGHRDLPEPTCKLVSAAIATHLGRFDSIDGISSLAEGADQIFAEQVLKAGGALTAVVPSAHYTRSFETIAGDATYRRLHAQAREVIELPFNARPRRPTGLRGSASSALPRCSSPCGTEHLPRAWAARPTSSPSPGSAASRRPSCGLGVRAAAERAQRGRAR